MIDQRVVEAYSQSGNDLPYFIGGNAFGGGFEQGGAGWLRTFGKFVFPIVKRLFNVVQNTAEDVLVKEEPLLSSLGSNAISEVSNFFSGKGVQNFGEEFTSPNTSITNIVNRYNQMKRKKNFSYFDSSGPSSSSSTTTRRKSQSPVKKRKRMKK